MILIDRGPEPSDLSILRKGELERIRKIVDPSRLDIGDSYRICAPTLRRVQFYKCCYCEALVQLSFNDVEHYRPKSRADRRPGSDEIHGYWWLAWTWENLLFACPSCNRSGKNARFPLATGSRPLVAEESPPGHENPLLINPADTDGIDDIQFVRLKGQNHSWVPEARASSLRGKVTVDVINLDRDELLELYQGHAEHFQELIAEIQAEIKITNASGVKKAWSRALRELRPKRPFLGLSYDLLDHSFPAPVRRRWGLELPRPPFSTG